MRISEAVRERRKKLGMSQIEAATAGGISDAQWRKLEGGFEIDRMRFATRSAIAKALRWPEDALDRIAAGEDPADLPTVDGDGEERYGQQGLTAAAVAALFEALPPDKQRLILAEMAELAANQIKDGPD